MEIIEEYPRVTMERKKIQKHPPTSKFLKAVNSHVFVE
jgi:hypothetical protein